jgi:hypothetical protein
VKGPVFPLHVDELLNQHALFVDPGEEAINRGSTVDPGEKAIILIEVVL